MTNLGDVIRQVEALLSDAEYPPTQEELQAMSKILKTIYTHYRLQRTARRLPAAAGNPVGTKKGADFLAVIPGFLRQIESRRQQYGQPPAYLC